MLVYELFGYSGMGCTATDLILSIQPCWWI